MLAYVSSGPRDFGRHPITPYARESWEFFVVLKGRIAPTLAPGSPPPRPSLAANSLWLFPPGHVHGWRGVPGAPARVAVFHFAHIAPALAARVPKGALLRVPLKPSALRTVTRLAHSLQPLLWREDAIAPLQAERAMLDLSVLTLESLPSAGARPTPSDARRVEFAERWFANHIADRPTLVSIACLLGLSTARMRRIFVAQRGLAPKAVFERLRIERAEQLLSAGDLKLEAVAAAAGYASASVFVQAFKRARGCTPDAWRRNRRRG